MRWEKYFTNQILERGRKYYQRGLVVDTKYDKNFVSAEVIGSKEYLVLIRKVSDTKTDFTCSCPYALGGNKCKHMAALCYALGENADNFMPTIIQEKKSDLTQGNMLSSAIKTVKTLDREKTADKENSFGRVPELVEDLFKPKNHKEEYFYYDMARITRDIKFEKSVVEEARRLIKEHTIALESVEAYFGREGSGEYLKVKGKGANTQRYSNSVELIVTANELKRAACNVAPCYSYFDSRNYYREKRLCKHQVALLLLLADYIDDYNPGDCTEQGAMQLLHYFEKKHRNQVMGRTLSDRGQLHLEARIERQWEGLELSFKVGKDKTYVIKNLTEFVDNVENEKQQLFGTKTCFDYGLDKICDADMPFYHFIEDIVARQQETDNVNRYRHSYMIPTVKVKDKIVLMGEKLDDFFTIAINNPRVIHFQDKLKNGKTEKMQFEECDPQITLYIQEFEDEGIFQGLYVHGKMPELIWGRDFVYCLEGCTLKRASEGKKEVIKALSAVMEGGDISFLVGRKMLTDFYYHTLPMLRKELNIVEENVKQLPEVLPPKAEFVFYLDMQEGELVCKPQVCYDDAVFSLLDVAEDAPYVKDKRDRSAEIETLFYVQKLFPHMDREKEVMRLEEKDDFFTVLEDGVPELLTLGEVYCSDAVKKLEARKCTKIKVGISLEGGLLNLDVVAEGIEKEELLQLLAGYRRKKKFYQLKNGDFVNLEDPNLEMLTSMMDTFRLQDKEFLKERIEIPAFRALYLDKVLERNDSLYVNRDRRYKQLIKEFKTIEDSDFELPRRLQADSRNYQEEGYKWLRTLSEYGFGGILADDMGLGKTLQVISVLQAKKEEGISGTSMVVCPSSLVFNWLEEFHKFAPEIMACTVIGTQGERQVKLESYRDYDVLITSYDLLRRDIAFYEDKAFYYQIVDEAQYIKNHTTAAAKAVKAVNSLYKYALTGTPIENRLSELWSIFDYLMPGFLYSYEVFKNDLETPIVKEQDETAQSRLKKMVTPFILRRLKEDVLKDLPEKIEKIQYTGFERKQQKLYDAQVVHMKDMLDAQSESDYNKGKIAILAELTKLRQICCDPNLLFENYTGESAKRDACMELIKSAIEGEHRLLLFSQFTSMLALLEEELKAEGISYFCITGSTPKEERLRLVKQFNEGNVPVFLISLKAGGTGLNLTGADVVIHYDPWWNVAAQNQATDRAHRIGQEKVVTVYKLIAKNTIEEKILNLQNAKQDLADAILAGETSSLASMSREDLLAIL